MPAPRKPQDHKTKALESEALAGGFEFTGKDGKTYTLPPFNLQGMTSGWLRKNRSNELELMYGALEKLADDDVIEALDEFNMDDLKVIFLDWQKSTGAEVPQS